MLKCSCDAITTRIARMILAILEFVPCDSQLWANIKNVMSTAVGKFTLDYR